MFHINPTKAFVKYLWQKYKSIALLGFVTMLIGAFIDLCSVLMVAPIFDLLLYEGGSGNSTKITEFIFQVFDNLNIPKSGTIALIIFFVIYLMRGAIAILIGWINAKIRASLVREMSVSTFKSVINSNWNFFLNKNQGEFINSLTKETVSLSTAYTSLSNCFVALFQLMTFSIIALIISWKITFVCLLVSFITAIPLILISRLNYKWGQKSVQASSESNSIIQESFSLAKVIQAFGLQNYAVKRLTKQQDIQHGLNVKFYTLFTLMHEIYYPLGLLSIITGYYFSKQWGIPFVELSVILFALWRCVPFITMFLRSFGQLGQFLPSFENINKLEMQAKLNPIQTAGIKVDSFEKSIELKDVDFSYSDADKKALDNINLEINKGEVVALVGSSGSGKSTLVDLIMGFHQPKSGKISVDDSDLASVSIDFYRSMIGYVPQQNVLFDTSIRENLCWGDDHSEDQLTEACKIANIYDHIKKLPDGFDTAVGDRGVKLSGGQVQRLAIARALLRKPEILVLDEATSALDSESESRIQEAIETISEKTTIIIIAHRYSTIKNADKVVVLNEGKLVECGDFQSLAADEKSLIGKLRSLQENNLADLLS